MPFSFMTKIFALNLLLSAALLFSVQPMFAKMILPLLGGAPQVWNTAMLFFQATLLAGYAYAHGSSKLLSLKTQTIVHGGLLVTFLVFLPFTIPEGWTPPAGTDPTFWQLGLMAVTIGAPFFILASTAPIMQRWLAGTTHPDAKNPYFLYSASNLGSMIGLLSYPFVIEPLFSLGEQSQYWTYGYGLLLLTTFLCVAMTHRNIAPAPKKQKTAKQKTVTWSQRLSWLVLAFIPASLMLGVTTFITTDIAAVPLIWIIPLSLYIGTFILAFARKQYIQTHTIIYAHSFLMIVLVMIMIIPIVPNALHMILHIALFFVSALLCHTQLVVRKPDAQNLTEFYLIMSLGGALGGVFNTIIATNFFVIPLEYTLVLAASCFVGITAKNKQALRAKSTIITLLACAAFIICAFLITGLKIKGLFAFALLVCLSFLIDTRLVFALAVSFALLWFPPGYSQTKITRHETLAMERSFFGVMKVIENKESQQRFLLHGTTNHGAQSILPDHRLAPLSYYSPFSPLSDVFRYMDKQRGKQNIAVVGLGIGATACYTNKGRHFDFFEIDEKVVEIAENPDYFTFLNDCGSPYEIILGDGRLTIQNQPDNHYDVILLDAFSSDNVPIHLLTLEALRIYETKLAPNGIIVFNVSNNYLDIEPVLALAAEKTDMTGFAKYALGGKLPDTDIEYYSSHYFVLTKNRQALDWFKKNEWTDGIKRSSVSLWTDQFSNIFSVIKNKSARKRIQAMDTESSAP